MNKITLDKQYKTRSGLPVRIYAVDVDGNYSTHGAYLSDDGWNIESWDNSGNCYDDIEIDDLDLIEVGKYDHINTDDKVLVLDNVIDGTKLKGHFAGLTKNGKPKIWSSGSTSFSVRN